MARHQMDDDKLEIPVVWSAPVPDKGPILRCMIAALRRMGSPFARLMSRVRNWPLD